MLIAVVNIKILQTDDNFLNIQDKEDRKVDNKLKINNPQARKDWLV